MNIKELIAEGKKRLTQNNIETPALDANLLAGFALQKTRTKLILDADKILSDDEAAGFFKLIERRANGECVAYILGSKEFRGLEFEVNPSVLVPRPDTETLVEAALLYIDSCNNPACKSKAHAQISVLDLCTGSGAIAVSLKHERPFVSLFATDISEAALVTAEQNSKRLLGSENAVRFLQSDLFNNISGNDIFNIIVSNPPYVSSAELATLAPEVKREPQIALAGGEDGLDLIRHITHAAGSHLLPGGVLLLEAAPGQMPAIKHLLTENGFQKIVLYKDLAGRERVIAGERLHGK
jgi:release factor glutamine methyltransferase